MKNFTTTAKRHTFFGIYNACGGRHAVTLTAVTMHVAYLGLRAHHCMSKGPTRIRIRNTLQVTKASSTEFNSLMYVQLVIRCFPKCLLIALHGRGRSVTFSVDLDGILESVVESWNLTRNLRICSRIAEFWLEFQNLEWNPRIIAES